MHRFVRRLLAAALSAAPLLATAQIAFDPAVAQSPPKLVSASLEWLANATAEGNALLRASFEKVAAKGPLAIQGPRGPVALRDDGIAPDAKAGDGIYTAIVSVDVAALRAEQQRRLSLAEQVKSVPRFEFRRLTGWTPFKPGPWLDPKAGGRFVLDDTIGLPVGVDAARSLLVRDTSVVEDPLRTYNPCTGTGTPMGPWTFGRLMTEMANQPFSGIHPSDFVEQWISEWKTDQTINGLVAPNRAIGAQALIDIWPKLPDGRLDLAQAPFRLLAIVNRLDLRTNTAYGGGNAGEARLVFGLVNCHGGGGHFEPQEPQGMTVIFEYGVPKSGCFNVRGWATQWLDLGSLALGSPAYNAALQAITDQFTLRDLAPGKPNRSAINQVRSNEFALAMFPIDTFWELRESRLTGRGGVAGQLEHATVAQTPDVSVRFTNTLRDYVNTFAPSILAGTHVVPANFPAGVPFLTGHIEPGAGFPWTAPGIVDLEARHRFSLATCNACHTVETGTSFLHIRPRLTGAASELSDFLTGANMPKSDPVSGVPRTFHDLLDRQVRLDATAHLSCSKSFALAFEELRLRPIEPIFRH